MLRCTTISIKWNLTEANDTIGQNLLLDPSAGVAQVPVGAVGPPAAGHPRAGAAPGATALVVDWWSTKTVSQK